MTSVRRGGRVPELSEGSVVDGRYRVAAQNRRPAGWPTSGSPRTRHLQRQVALKVLHSRFAQDREFVERFRREAESAAGLNHPNIVSVYDRGDVDGTYYIAMQYLQGRSLKELIDIGADPRAVGLPDPPGPRGRPLRPPQRRRPPRPQAAERDRRRRGQGGRHRLRHRPRRGLGDHPDRLGDGHPALPLARAGPGRRGDPGLRPLLDRRDALRGARRPGPLRRRKRRRGGDETGLAGAAAAELDQTRGLTGARRGRDAGAREEPRRPLPDRRRLHRRPRRRAQGGRRGERRHRRLRAAAAGGRRVDDADAAEMDEIEEEERRRRRRCADRWPRSRSCSIALLDLRPDPRHLDRGPERDRQPARTCRRTRCDSEGFKVGEIRRSRARSRTGNRCSSRTRSAGRQVDDRLLASSTSSARSRRSTSRSAPGPGSGKVPGDRRRCRRRRRPRSSKKPASRSRSTRVNSTEVEEGLVIHSDPSGGSTATRGIDRHR